MKIEVIIAAIIEGIVTLIVGFCSGYSVGINKKNKFNQKARNNANQIQIGEINNGK